MVNESFLLRFQTLRTLKEKPFTLLTEPNLLLEPEFELRPTLKTLSAPLGTDKSGPTVGTNY